MNKLTHQNMKRKRGCSDFLFPKSTFIVGMGSVLNIGGNYFEFNSSNSDLEADLFAMRNDWECVGNEIKSASEILSSQDS